MAATKIKVTVHSVEALDDANVLGAGEWTFNANVKRVATGEVIAFGDPNEEFEINTGQAVRINWSKDVEIKGTDTKLEINLSGKDDGIWADESIGKVKITLNTPIVHAYDLNLTSDTKNYIARVQVDIVSATAVGTGSVTTIRQSSRSTTHNTVHDEMMTKMVHIHPVSPVPWTTGLPPLAKGVKSLTEWRTPDLSISTGAPLNGLVNPAFIVTMRPGRSGFLKRCARVRVTQHRPANLDLSKLVWKVASGNIKFWHGGKGVTEVKGGREVNVYGTNKGADQKCKIEVRWDSEGEPLLATFRAWVGKPKYVWCRANIIKTTAKIGPNPMPNPTLTVAQVKSHIKFSNRILRQAGIRMVMDTDDTAFNGAVKKSRGIFEVSSGTNYTFNAPDDANFKAPLLNARKGVFNMAYIHSIAGAGNQGVLGEATDRRMSPAETTVRLGGSPSSAWVRPTGVFPDGAARTVSMKRMGPSRARSSSLKSICGDGKADTLNNISACYMTQNVAGRLARGNITLPHELGHVLGLHHRGNGGGETRSSTDDVNHKAGPRRGRGHPWNENFMCYGSDARRQDLDMIQVQVMRSNPLVKSVRPPRAAAPPAPAPAPAPSPDNKPVPASGLPSKADIELMQGYLGGAKPGLTHSGYSLGTSGPNGDGVDGINGTKTRKAIRDFQKDHGGLTRDSKYGRKTRAAFDKELNGP